MTRAVAAFTSELVALLSPNDCQMLLLDLIGGLNDEDTWQAIYRAPPHEVGNCLRAVLPKASEDLVQLGIALATRYQPARDDRPVPVIRHY